MSKFKEGDRAILNSNAFDGAPLAYREKIVGSHGTITQVLRTGAPFDVEFNPDVDWEEGPGPWPLFEDELDLIGGENGDK